jgi:hypothetical protein
MQSGQEDSTLKADCASPQLAGQHGLKAAFFMRSRTARPVCAPVQPGPVSVRPEGFEPPTLGFEVRRSIQLSYRRVVGNRYAFSPRASSPARDESPFHGETRNTRLLFACFGSPATCDDGLHATPSQLPARCKRMERHAGPALPPVVLVARCKSTAYAILYKDDAFVGNRDPKTHG